MNIKDENFTKLSLAALVFSLFPLFTLFLTLLKISLTSNIQTVLAGANILFVLIGLVLSIICIRHTKNRTILNIFSAIISFFWILLMIGIIGFALLNTFVS